MLKLYILEKRCGGYHFDVLNSIVVTAKNSKQARQLAAARAGGEGRDTWLKASKSLCKEFKPGTVPGVEILDFLNG
jgi:hypothetical protein